ncbi:hypothetical protein AQUCO_02000470v1 [Aquilegia coerulea]|uniref:Uncharacterized protein n=1 Tax=Aquilegia coerulea TaxID=218851 RepID=A0A2G5DHU9_AQUCA|nr:hypothetical protein AQUCO_02000470v1 [Aquilegia coerulea]
MASYSCMLNTLPHPVYSVKGFIAAQLVSYNGLGIHFRSSNQIGFVNPGCTYPAIAVEYIDASFHSLMLVFSMVTTSSLHCVDLSQANIFLI